MRARLLREALDTDHWPSRSTASKSETYKKGLANSFEIMMELVEGKNYRAVAIVVASVRSFERKSL